MHPDLKGGTARVRDDAELYIRDQILVSLKKFEKIVLVVLFALLIGRICAIPGTAAFFTLTSFFLGLAYFGFGFHILRRTEATPRWLAILSGFTLGPAMAALPYATFVRQERLFKLAPVLVGVLLVIVLVRRIVARRRNMIVTNERLLIIRSLLLLGSLSFLLFMPPIGLFRSVIIALNRGNERLVANMRMVEEFDAYQEEFKKGDCGSALLHAQASNRQGRIWLFGFDDAKVEWKTSTRSDLGNGTGFNLDSLMRQLKIQEEQEQLWMISRTYDDVYYAYQCLARHAEEVSNDTGAFRYFQKADSVLNVIKGREGYWNEERVWSLGNVAGSAVKLGMYELSDSLYNRSLKLYEEINDSLDDRVAGVLADWARSLSHRKEWAYANYLFRIAISLAEHDRTGKVDEHAWIGYRLELVKSLISTDSTSLAERILSPCERAAQADSAWYCEVLLVKGALRYRMDAYRSADTAFADAVDCLSRSPNKEATKVVAYYSWGHTKAALGDYGEAREMVNQGRRIVATISPYPLMEGGLDRLGALIDHLQGHYSMAKKEYGTSLRVLALDHRSADQVPAAMAGLAEVLIDLAEPALARTLADSALAMVADPIQDMFPGQVSVLNTAADADYNLNDLEKADERYSTALRVCERYDATVSSVYAQALNGKGLVAMARSRYTTADSLLSQAYATCLSIYGPEHPFTARVLINQAQLRERQGKIPEALSLLRAALPITERFLGKDHDQLGDIYQALGEIEQRSADRTEARKHFAEALRIYRVCFPADHPKVLALEKAR